MAGACHQLGSTLSTGEASANGLWQIQRRYTLKSRRGWRHLLRKSPRQQRLPPEATKRDGDISKSGDCVMERKRRMRGYYGMWNHNVVNSNVHVVNYDGCVVNSNVCVVNSCVSVVTVVSVLSTPMSVLSTHMSVLSMPLSLLSTPMSGAKPLQ